MINHKVKKVVCETDKKKHTPILWTIYYKNGTSDNFCIDDIHPLMRDIRSIGILPTAYLIDNSRAFHYIQGHLFNYKEVEGFPGFERNPKKENVALKEWVNTLWDHTITIENHNSSMSVKVQYDDFIEERMSVTKDKMITMTTHDLREPLEDQTYVNWYAYH